MRPTRVEIDLSAIRHNLEAIRNLVNTKIMMAIKADAYGHGAQVVGRFVEKHSLVDMLGVASIEEGISLRESGIKLPIIIFALIGTSVGDIDAIFHYDLRPTVIDMSIVEHLVSGAHRWQKMIGVHVKTDTGMGRLGLPPKDTMEIITHISTIKELRLEGIYTHFPLSDIPDTSFTSMQVDRFNSMADELARLNIDTGLRHSANSGAILTEPSSYMDMVRPGILCYGLYPSATLPKSLDVVPAMTFKSAIMFVKRVSKGTGLSYGHTYRPKKDTYIATVPVGYADGYPRSLSNRARVIIQGKEYPIVGRVCMDQSLVDLGDDKYSPGEEVILFGKDSVTAEDVAIWADTIPYEITCNMSRRVQRVYTENS
ncbi:MAG: alanine racemase [Deltaproteobacteria bacterium]|nr:alanine racemase [Deltaproteobacteria bacterium]